MIFSIQLICFVIGVIFIAWNVIEIINGIIFTGHWWRSRYYFASDPISFSFQGGFYLALGLGICFICQIPKIPQGANKTIVFGCAFVIWAGLSLISYLLGYAGQSWRDAHSIERIKDPSLQVNIQLPP